LSDMLVRLYALPPSSAPTRMEAIGVVIRRALPPERRLIVRWVAEQFHDVWAAECEMALSSLPVTLWIAQRGNALLGFACHDATAKGMFGPTAVLESERRQGIGEALLLTTLAGMREAGYPYAIIGDPGPVDFYRRCVNAIEIPDSTPGLYRGMLRSPRT
jgi:hypothetical protein